MRIILLVLFLLSFSLTATIALAQATDVAQPIVLSYIAPRYPPIALAAGVKGTFIVEVTVLADGSISSAKVVQGHPLLNKVILDAAQKWRFGPLTMSANEQIVRLNFNFDVKDEETTNTWDETRFIPPNSLEIIHVYGLVATLSEYYQNIKKCPHHGDLLKMDTVPIRYGLPISTVVRGPDIANIMVALWRKVRRVKTYQETAESEFPYASLSVGGGCMVDRETKAEVLYCPTCCSRELKWRKKHGLVVQ
jgi:TonB family protein